MAVLTLHSGRQNKNAYKALIVAEYLGITIAMPEEFQMNVHNKTPEFLKLNPQGKVPVLETPEGPIWESNAIARYVAKQKENKLLGETIYEQGLVDQWIDFGATELDKLIGLWVYPQFGFMPRSLEMEQFVISQLEKALTVLNDFLGTHTFLVGDFITLADIVVGCNLYMGYKTVLSKEFTSKFPHLDRYFWTVFNQPEFIKVIGPFVQGERDPSKVNTPGKTEIKTVVEPSSAEKRPSGPKVKPIPQPKEAPKSKEAPKPKEAAVDEEEAPKPKAKNPLDLLPPSTFVIDDWKRLYSNTKAKDFAAVAIKGFWEMFDPAGWSFWFADYKYNEENEKTYVTMNKVGGFLQRLDFIRKYAFGKMLILSENAPFKIKGVWLFRGQEIPQQVIDECYDVELYTWTKADLSSEEQKARINAYFEEPDYVDVLAPGRARSPFQPCQNLSSVLNELGMLFMFQ